MTARHVRKRLPAAAITARKSARPEAQPDPDAQLLERLRSGDEQAFIILVRRYRPSMVRLAAAYVPSQAVAEEVVQEAWLGFLNGISRFEGRSTVRTWLFRILINRARTTGIRERRTTAVGDLTAAVDGARFDGAGNWVAPPQPWTDVVEDRLAAQAMAKAIRAAMADLPVRQREVVTLRDVEGLSSEEVCGVLEITEANQRVLLHRGRSRLRQRLESEFGRA
jgi:RNA polymerase sigma-70 factor, ECF subfamily